MQVGCKLEVGYSGGEWHRLDTGPGVDVEAQAGDKGHGPEVRGLDPKVVAAKTVKKGWRGRCPLWQQKGMWPPLQI